ncbi:MAG TPA: hypothetical protein VFE88_00855 [Candidatus Nanoarchaeia archaeon]|nr:hypothetical protein [Candidatus Nanoarchaeia archaeon]
MAFLEILFILGIILAIILFLKLSKNIPLKKRIFIAALTPLTIILLFIFISALFALILVVLILFFLLSLLSSRKIQFKRKPL